MLNRVYSNWMDSLNFFVGIHFGGDDWGDLDLLSERYQFHRRTIWITRYAVSAPVQFGPLLFFVLVWPDTGGWLALPWLTFNLLVFPPFMLWLLMKLRVIVHKS